MGFSDFFSKQAGHPSGWFGRWVMSLVFDRGNARLNGLMKSGFQVQPGDRILEIGCGTGKLINGMAAEIGEGCVEGVEISQTMAAMARKRNRRTLADDRVIIHLGDFNQIRFNENTYDTVCSCNTIYFWTDPLFTLKKIHSIIKPGGKILVAFEDKSRLAKRKLSSDVFRLYSHGEVRDLFKKCGFGEPIEIKNDTDRVPGLCCVWALK